VAAKSAVVSPTAMNVLYAGLDNPLSVSVPGVAQRDVTAVFDGPGTLTRQADGSYSVKPTGKGKFKIKVSAKVDGNNLSMGDMEFRVKRVPEPVPTLDGIYQSGNMSAPKLKSTSGVVPQLNDFVLAGVKFEVISYTAVPITPDGVQKFPTIGARYDTKFREMLDKGRIKKGCTVVFEDIIVRDPAGEKRSLAPIAIAVTSN
jgi:hypothetical protein